MLCLSGSVNVRSHSGNGISKNRPVRSMFMTQNLQSFVFQNIKWWLNQIKAHCVVFYIQFFLGLLNYRLQRWLCRIYRFAPANPLKLCFGCWQLPGAQFLISASYCCECELETHTHTVWGFMWLRERWSQHACICVSVCVRCTNHHSPALSQKHRWV